MTVKAKASKTTIPRQAILATVAALVAPLPLIPAVLVNLESAAGASYAWVACAVATVIMSAVFVEVSKLAWMDRRWFMGWMFFLAGFACLVGNLNNALVNASATSDHRSDHRAKIIADAEKARSQRSQWSQSRIEQSRIAGEIAADVIEADIQAKIASDSRRWQATSQCDPLQVTVDQSREFCGEVAALRAKKAAAEKRDELDKKIADLDRRTSGTEVVTSVDPYADNVAAFMGLFGIVLTDEQKSILGASRDWLKTILLELLATLGPSAVLYPFQRGAHRREPRSPEPELKKPAPQRAPVAAPISAAASTAPIDGSPPIPLGDPFHAFVAHCLESHDGSYMRAGDAWKLWQHYCQSKQLDVGTQKSFGQKMKTRFAHDRNNNRPRYLNLRAKALTAEPPLRLAVSN